LPETVRHFSDRGLSQKIFLLKEWFSTFFKKYFCDWFSKCVCKSCIISLHFKKIWFLHNILPLFLTDTFYNFIESHIFGKMKFSSSIFVIWCPIQRHKMTNSKYWIIRMSLEILALSICRSHWHLWFSEWPIWQLMWRI